MSKMKKIMLMASGVALTMEQNTENDVFVTVGQGLIEQAVKFERISLRHFVAQNELHLDRYLMNVEDTNYKLTFENLKRISDFLGCPIEVVS